MAVPSGRARTTPKRAEGPPENYLGTRSGRAVIFAVPYFVTGALCVLFLFSFLNLWGTDLAYPINVPRGDFLSTATIVKSILVNGWCFHIPQVGAPHGLDFYDYPLTETVHFLFFKVLSVFTSDPALAINIYYILGYVLASLSALYVLGALGLPVLPSMAAGLLFAFLPHHYMRGEYHLFLSSYYLLPLACLVIIWVAQGLPLIENSPLPRRFRYVLTSKGKAALIICAIMGGNGVYYAIFAAAFLLCASAYAFFRKFRLRNALPGVALAAVITASVIVNAAPTLIYQLRFGKNTQVAARSFVEAEAYGMRIAALLTPIPSHRIPSVAHQSQTYLQGVLQVLKVEDITAALGAVGSLGFLILIGWLLLGRARDRGDDLLDPLCALNAVAVFMATLGGFGSLFAFVVSTKIRAYHRISVYIAFFSLAAVVIVLQHVQRRWLARRAPATVFYASTALIMYAGLWDLTPRMAPVHESIKAAYDADRSFVRQIEGSVPKGSMIFQLPYHPFPEHGFTHKMLDYDPFRGFIHSDTLRWSYGAMKGRPADEWVKQVASQPAPQMVATLAAAGFQGVWLDREGYPDAGVAVASQLSAALGSQTIESQDKRFIFFPMVKYVAAMRAAGGNAMEGKRQQALELPVTMSFRGCTPPSGVKNFWCPFDGELELQNAGSEARKLRLAMTFQTATGRPATLSVGGDLVSRELRIGAQGVPFSADVVVPTGRRTVTFHCDAKPAKVAGDPRVLVFAILDFTTTER